MRKKNTIRLNESELKNIVKESVKKIVNETSDNAQRTYNAALEKAEKYGKRERRYLSKEYYDAIDKMKEIRDCAYKLCIDFNYLYNRNPRLNLEYLERLSRTCREIYYAFDEDGSIADAIINQVSNKWHHPGFHDDFEKPFNRPYKIRDVWEPVDDNEDDSE